MTTQEAVNGRGIAEYTQRILGSNPAEALKIALAEADREKQIALAAQAEYRAMSEIDFDQSGRIIKANMGGLWRLAQIYSKSLTVPEQYRGKPEDCFIICQMAFRLKADPYALMQASYVVHGKPGVESKFLTAMLNASGKIIGRVRYKDERDTKTGKMIACTAYVKDAESQEEVYGPRIDWDLVQAEGWHKKTGSKWMTSPELMFRYRAASWLINQSYPEVRMGMQSVDEIQEEAGSSGGSSGPAISGRPSSIQELTDRLSQDSQDASRKDETEAGSVDSNESETDPAKWRESADSAAR